MASRYVESAGVQREIEIRVSAMLDEVLPACEADAKRYVPILTGYLRDHIGSKKTSPTTGVVYADAEYAAAVEKGYVHHRSGEHIAAQPYLRPAVLKHRAELT